MPSATDEAPKVESRLLLISNRLPITIKRSPEGKYDFSMSSGGLVTGLSGLAKSTTFQWYGWPGLEVPENESEDLVKRLKDEFNAIPVFVDDELADRHYNGFSSKSPLFGYYWNWLIRPRFDYVAALPLPSRRDHVRRVILECLRRSQPAIRPSNRQRS